MLKRSLTIIIFLSLVLIVALSFYRAKIRTSQYETLPFAVHCSNLKIGTLHFSGRVLVHDHWIKKFDLSHHPELAVKEQLKFLAGDIHFGALSESTAKLMLLHGHDIRIKKLTALPYGRSLQIAPDANNFKLQIQSQDPALAIEYEAEQSIATCDSSEAPIHSLGIDLPNDPFTVFWLVPKQDWLSFNFMKRSAIVNPCANSEIVSAPRASGYPYLWMPRAEGIDASGRKFHCDKWLKQGVDYQTVNGTFTPTVTRSQNLNIQEIERAPELRMALFFGFVSGGDEGKSLGSAKKFFSAPEGELSSLIDTGRATPYRNEEKQDAAVWATLDFLKQLNKSAKLVQVDVETSQTFLALHARAILKKSKKKLHMSIYLVSTNYNFGWQEGPLLKEMRDSQFIFYVGHSAIGENLDWSRLSANFPKKQSYQMIGVISCYSTSFYPSYYEKYRAGQKLKTDLLLVDLVSYRYLLPLGIVSYLDQIDMPKRLTLSEELAKFVGSKELVLWQRKDE